MKAYVSCQGYDGILLRVRTNEIAGCAATMRKHAIKVPHNLNVLEIVGTGGDGARSFNISTTSAIVIASGGVKVAKLGNRAASSKCGTADCLEALGVNIDLSPEKCIELLARVLSSLGSAPLPLPSLRLVYLSMNPFPR